jgi:hypothetical protein
MWITQRRRNMIPFRVVLTSEQQGIDATGQSGRVTMQIIRVFTKPERSTAPLTLKAVAMRWQLWVRRGIRKFAKPFGVGSGTVQR